MIFPKKRATICSHAVTSKFEGRVRTQSGIKLLINHWHMHRVLLRRIKYVIETMFVLTFKKCIPFLVLLKPFKNICNTWTV